MAEQEEHFDQLEELFMSEDLFHRLRELKEEKGKTVADIDGSITDIQHEFKLLRDRLNEFDEEQQKLLTVLIARSIKRALREMIIQDTNFPEHPD